ncbi:MAG: universal stress protein [Deltaproteobacteria bacterium]|nr:universal stress protein [Deltaproteobacteria bacterium]
MIPPIPGHQLFLFIIQFALLLTSARLLGELLKRYGQPPVFGELLAGIILGPSLLGWLFPWGFAALFPPDVQQFHLLELISWLGMLFLLLLTGLETDLALLRRLGRPAMLASLFGIIIPFAFGYLLGTTIPDHLLANPAQRLIFELFLGTALAISAVPVIAKILLDLGILKRNIGTIVMAAAIVDDIAGWTILSMLMGMMAKGTLDVTAVAQGIASTTIFVGVALVVGVRVVRRMLRWIDEHVQVEEAHITAILVVTLICAAITEAIGIHAIFGAFVAGVLFAQSPRVRANALEKLVGVVHGVFTPVFFAFVGLRVDLTQLQDPKLVILVLVTACAGKLVGCTLGGLLGRLSWWESVSIGIGMNARGGMELIIALVGLTSGILSSEVYSSLVLMAMVTSLMAPPLLKWSLSHIPPSSEEQERLNLTAQRSIFDKRTLRVLLPTAGGPNAMTALRMAAPMVSHDDAVVTALFLHTDSASIFAGRWWTRWWRTPGEMPDDPFLPLQQVARESGVTLEKRAVAMNGAPLATVILKEAQRGYDLIFLGASSYQHPLGGTFLEAVLIDPPAHVAIIKARDEKPRYERILVPTTGDAHSQLAIEFAAMYAEDTNAHVTLFHVLPLPERPRSWWPRRRETGLDHQVLNMMADTMVWEMRPAHAKPDLRLAAKVIEGEHPTEEILREASRGGYDLVVFGTANRSGRADSFLGHRAEQLVNQAPCTVVVVLPKGLRASVPH